MTQQIAIFAVLLFGVSLLSVLADKMRVSYPILLVIAGLCIGFVPGMPSIRLNPEIVFFIFLPPLLYSAAWATSWHDFRKAKRSIGLLAFGLVACTSTVVAFTANWLIPDFPLALGFLLGGIISPPDAVAATSVTKGLSIPRRIITLLEGESLINDASSLIIYRFALAAVITGQFSLTHALGQFVIVSLMGVAIGLAVGYLVYQVHLHLPTTSSVDTAMTLISPYLAYIFAEFFHFSGVLAVVTTGLFLSWRAPKIFSYNTRIQAIAVWQTLEFVLNGVIFVLIGLQLPHIVHGLGDFTLADAIMYALVISIVTILVRIVWMFPGAYLPRLLSKRIRSRESKPRLAEVFIVGWSGMRGVVSLAAALALPFLLADGSVFPYRNLILFITFVVILMTLGVQGLTLPWLIQKLNIKGEEEHSQERDLRLHLSYQSVMYIEENYLQEDATRDALHHIKSKYEKRIDQVYRHMLTADLSKHSQEVFYEYNRLQLQLIGFERQELMRLRKENKFSDELIRRVEYELDLEEAQIRHLI